MSGAVPCWQALTPAVGVRSSGVAIRVVGWFRGQAERKQTYSPPARSSQARHLLTSPHLPKGLLLADFTIIQADEMEFTPRGRKSNADPKLIAALGELTAGTALRLDSLAVKVTGDAKTIRRDRARVSAQVRSAAKAAGVTVAIHWSRAGIPQVTVKPKTSAKRTA